MFLLYCEAHKFIHFRSIFYGYIFALHKFKIIYKKDMLLSLCRTTNKMYVVLQSVHIMCAWYKKKYNLKNTFSHIRFSGYIHTSIYINIHKIQYTTIGGCIFVHLR